MSVKARVLKVLAEIFGEEGEGIDLNTIIGTDLALTSLERMTLFIALEDEFDRFGGEGADRHSTPLRRYKITWMPTQQPILVALYTGS